MCSQWVGACSEQWLSAGGCEKNEQLCQSAQKRQAVLGIFTSRGMNIISQFYRVLVGFSERRVACDLSGKLRKSYSNINIKNPQMCIVCLIK